LSNILAPRERDYAAAHFIRRHDFEPVRTPATRSGLKRALDVNVRAASLAHRDFVSDFDLKTWDVNLVSVHQNVPVRDELSRLRHTCCRPRPPAGATPSR